MSEPVRAGAAGNTRRELVVRNMRLVSGLILMAFVVTHLINHALGLISLGTAEQGRHIFLSVWRNPLGTLLFYGAVLVHVALTLLALYRRHTLSMPPREWAQVVLGLAIPLLIAEHVVGTRGLHQLFQAKDTYAFVVEFWSQSAANSIRIVIALLVIWAHGCLGLFFWLRYRPWFPRAAPYLLVLGVLIPVLALLGFSDMSREVAAMESPSLTAIDPDVVPAALAAKDTIDRAVYAAYVALLALVLGARAVRDHLERRNMIEIRYPGGRSVRVAKGCSVLDASRLGGINHYAVCGGRGRCSTCRIRVFEGLADQPEPDPVEARTLLRISAEDDVRLACQLRPTHDLGVAPLLSPLPSNEAPMGAASDPGHEKVVAVMFCDMRSFTAFADQRLPFDVVFLLNRYFGVVGNAVESAGGRLDKFIGDGAMALFGLEGRPDEACREALLAARAIIDGVDRLSEDLSAEFRGHLRVAIGIHVGQAIVGSMGYGRAMSVTAIGDTVNVGSRLEAAAKEFDAAIVVSEAAAKLSGLDLSGFDAREIEIRGRARPLGVYVLRQGATAPAPVAVG
ncbi:adenylate/guanylate cyclase domain-containing protein [Pseudaminobacter sp. 19-2017]|uniref:Adenylate/guanylate cyclase domain-containing protein n=1 Tax=Pseudaminobacter soli (ex Zhang et al. 2022) TaxID=2831468 RepID=A0A942DWI6_9HYPH|nr:adenylate/guanylate cyclase domain-containing protein [Pseudaminobacter soli]MBS3648999.1 adenylate/guanylate cyclase domain-containing protein [Pseudaminobacter soli]